MLLFLTISVSFVFSKKEKAQKKFRAPGENRTHDPPSSSSNALTTELLEALWRGGSKFYNNYTSLYF